MVYEIRGPFTAIDQPYVPVVNTSSFGDNFETYPLGLINVLTSDSSVFSAPGAVVPAFLGVVAIENIDAYSSGSTPSLTAGSGWVNSGSFN